MHAHGMDTQPVTMAVSGLLVAVAVPALIHVTRHRAEWQKVALPAAVVLPLFLVLHGVITLTMPLISSLPVHLLLEALLLCGAILFWLPVMGTRHRLSDPARSVYLYLAMPLLDLPAVAMVALGHVAGGLAMIVAMLPIGLAALAITWRWVTAEERLAQAQVE
ncbi:hypothetical protein [Streptomyces sp. SLBN-31]|uniref:hypothetical protein n=1 Tax=Streptomyces sp. SLBN-31 TaxID=2768444 RepID=UPI0021B2231F|nr:hypothetical protein [Streptomyces sp. SLBN-31]